MSILEIDVGTTNYKGVVLTPVEKAITYTLKE